MLREQRSKLHRIEPYEAYNRLIGDPGPGSYKVISTMLALSPGFGDVPPSPGLAGFKF